MNGCTRIHGFSSENKLFYLESNSLALIVCFCYTESGKRKKKPEFIEGGDHAKHRNRA